jgi:acetyltransferase-like isoleucine patch superfamily enzyme
LTIGDHSFVGHDCCFHVARGIRVGTHCLLAGGSRFYDTDGHPLDARRRRHERISPDQAQEIRLGDDVWVGAGCTVLKGVTIGNRAIVGAGSVVTRDVPADTIVAGNPARVLRSLASAEPAAAAGADTRDS